MDSGRILAELKRDGFGVVELVERDGRRAVRRVARGGAFPGSRLVARALLRREAAALGALAELAERGALPSLVPDPALAALPCRDGYRPRAGEVLVRAWLEGEPLHRARALPEDFFDLLDELVLALHARGVCHNDLHKEQNVLVRAGGAPALIDFQLASRHRRRGVLYRSRVHDDLRHVHKHRRRYTRDGRGPATADAAAGAGHGLRRTRTSAAWRRIGKPLYLWLTRRVLKTRDGEERRESSGPWPRWTPPLGERRGARDRPRGSG